MWAIYSAGAGGASRWKRSLHRWTPISIRGKWTISVCSSSPGRSLNEAVLRKDTRDFSGGVSKVLTIWRYNQRRSPRVHVVEGELELTHDLYCLRADLPTRGFQCHRSIYVGIVHCLKSEKESFVSQRYKQYFAKTTWYLIIEPYLGS